MPQVDSRNPPEVRFDPLALLVRGFPADTLGTFAAAARRHGDVVRLRGGPWRAYLVTHPSHVARVLHDNQTNYDKRDRLNSVLKPVLGEGLLTSDGSVWRQERRLIQPAFRPQRFPQLATLITDAAESMLERWRAHAESGQTVDALTAMRRLTFGVLAKGFFDSAVEYTAAIDEAAAAFFEFFDFKCRHVLSLPLAVPTARNRRFRRAFAALDEVIDGIIAARESGGGHGDDVLALLLAARKSDAGPTPKQVRDEVATLIRVGYETPAVALAWTWYLLGEHPDAERRLHAELDEVLAGRRPAIDDLPRLPYLRAVLEESMRLYPPVWAISRRAIGEDEIGGYRVPAGAQIILCPYVTHRHAGFWENAEVFDPARFSPERAAARPRGAFLPFGDGQRRCIGDGFAMLETQLIAATVAQHYRLRLARGVTIVPSLAFTLRPRDGLPMTVGSRAAAAALA